MAPTSRRAPRALACERRLISLLERCCWPRTPSSRRAAVVASEPLALPCGPYRRRNRCCRAPQAHGGVQRRARRPVAADNSGPGGKGVREVASQAVERKVSRRLEEPVVASRLAPHPREELGVQRRRRCPCRLGKAVLSVTSSFSLMWSDVQDLIWGGDSVSDRPHVSALAFEAGALGRLHRCGRVRRSLAAPPRRRRAHAGSGAESRTIPARGLGGTVCGLSV